MVAAVRPPCEAGPLLGDSGATSSRSSLSNSARQSSSRPAHVIGTSHGYTVRRRGPRHFDREIATRPDVAVRRTPGNRASAAGATSHADDRGPCDTPPTRAYSRPNQDCRAPHRPIDRASEVVRNQIRSEIIRGYPYTGSIVRLPECPP